MKLGLLSALVAVFALTEQEQREQRWGVDWPFSGISTFAHLPAERCLLNASIPYDVAVIGVPFDTAVSYRPGARFGPRAIRSASMRQNTLRGFNPRAGFNPYQAWATLLDCSDMPISPIDNKLALTQMTHGFRELLDHPVASPKHGRHPRLVSLGGDHSIVLPHLRALKDLYGPISVIHFDAHLDTWIPTKYPSGWSDIASEISGEDSGHFTHGTMFWMAHEENLLSETCVHAGLRTRLSGVDWSDFEDDAKQGFARITTDDIDRIGVDGIARAIKSRIPEGAPVYISVDIDSLDPAFAPATGTPEAGGWTSRELIAILRSIEDLNVVGADVVEVSPAYDNAEITALAAAQITYEIITSMVLQRSGVSGIPIPAAGFSDDVHDEL